MKKLLLTLLAVVLTIGIASAETVKVDFTKAPIQITDGANESTVTKTDKAELGDLTLNDNLSLASNGKWWTQKLRFYSNNTLEIKASSDVKITKIAIAFTYKAFNGNYKVKDGDATTYSSATNYSSGKATSGTYTWTADAGSNIHSILFTNTGEQSRLNSIEITYELASSSNLQAANLKFPEASYIAVLGETFNAPEATGDTKVAPEYTSTNTEVAEVDKVSGAVTIKKVGTTTIKATTVANDIYAAGNASYTLTVVDKKANSISELLTLAPNKDDQALVACNLTVVYANGLYVYVVDAEGSSTLLYDTNSFKAGNVIPGGWVATAAPYSGLPEYKGEFPASTTNAEFTIPTIESVSDADINRVVVLKNVTFADATPANRTNFDGTVNSATLQFRNNFTIASVPAGVYDVKLAVGTFSETLQAYPIEYTKVVSTEVKPFVTDPEAVNETITVAKGAVVKFTAAGAAKIDYTVEGSETKTGTAEGEVFELTATEACTVDLKAYDINGEVKQTAIYMVELEAAPLCGEITFDPAAGEIAKGTVVTVKAENAVKYEYIIEPGENTDFIPVEESEFNVTISEDCTLQVIAYNADGKSVEGSAAYTVVEGPAASSVEIVFNSEQSSGPISKANATTITKMINEKSQSFITLLSAPSNLNGGAAYNGNNSVRFGSYSKGSYSKGTLTINLAKSYKITSIDALISTWESTNASAPANPTWNLDINGYQMAEDITTEVANPTSYNISFETVARESADVKTLVIQTTNAPVNVYSLRINYESINTGVDDIVADDANAPVEYYNLQGVRVANPESGLYIRVQGKKASKVLVK